MVTQEDDLGCGVAAVANILGINYKDALRGFDRRRVETFGSTCKDIVRVLEKNGIQAKYRYINKKLKSKIYKPKTIVFIKRSNKYQQGHYFVRVADGWCDSWINLQQDCNIKNAKSGIRKRLPGKPIYAIFI